MGPRFVAIYQQTMERVGAVGLYGVDYRVRKAEFGMFLGDRRYRGQGIGTLVTRATVDYGFRAMNLHKVWLSVLATNQDALALYERVGFRRDGA